VQEEKETGICPIETGWVCATRKKQKKRDRREKRHRWRIVDGPCISWCTILRRPDQQNSNLFLNLQIAGFNGLSDALKRLDFLSAVHDCRRFNYIVRLLDLLVSHRMGGLSGCAQRVLFNMLEEVALEGKQVAVISSSSREICSWLRETLLNAKLMHVSRTCRKHHSQNWSSIIVVRSVVVATTDRKTTASYRKSSSFQCRLLLGW